MDERSNEYFSSSVTDHEMNIIECLSDGGDEGEADDEEIGYIGEEDSEECEEAADEEDETIDSVSFSSDNFNGNSYASISGINHDPFMINLL